MLSEVLCKIYMCVYLTRETLKSYKMCSEIKCLPSNSNVKVFLHAYFLLMGNSETNKKKTNSKLRKTKSLAAE